MNQALDRTRESFCGAASFLLRIGLACGAAHLPLWIYLLGSAISSIVWSVVFTEVGYLFGEAAITALRRMERYDEYVVAVLLGVGLVALLIWRQRRQRRQQRSGAPPADRTPAVGSH